MTLSIPMEVYFILGSVAPIMSLDPEAKVTVPQYVYFNDLFVMEYTLYVFVAFVL